MKISQWFIVSSSFFLLTACQLFTPWQTAAPIESYYGQYYLWLKNLPKEKLHAEAVQQQASAKAGDVSANFKLILLYSLPDSPIHNAYNAKEKLNYYQTILKQPINKQFSEADLGLIALLKDQLNQQLFLYQQLVAQEKYQHNMQLKFTQQQQNIAHLSAQVSALQQQIKQLKKIEKTIQQRGQ